MWIFNSCGFFSIVEKAEDQGTGKLTIRARVREDLVALRGKFMPELEPITSDTNLDYPYRARITRAAFAEGMKRMAEEVDYPNFKQKTFESMGANRARIYGKVWRDLMELEDGDQRAPCSKTSTRMAWCLAKTLQAFQQRYGHWPSRIEMPKDLYNLLLMDIGELWHKPMSDKLDFGLGEKGIRALDDQGQALDYEREAQDIADHREAFIWMFS